VFNTHGLIYIVDIKDWFLSVRQTYGNMPHARTREHTYTHSRTYTLAHARTHMLILTGFTFASYSGKKACGLAVVTLSFIIW